MSCRMEAFNRTDLRAVAIWQLVMQVAAIQAVGNFIADTKPFSTVTNVRYVK